MKPPLFVRGDLDGFFGLFIDNLLQLMLITFLCSGVAGLSSDFVVGRILPAAALSILAGNIFYAWQARRLARETGRSDVTALPFGINTPSLVAFIFLVMVPVYQETGDPTAAWKAGLGACLFSGIMETAGAFVGDTLRRVIPRAALLSSLAGIAVTFIAMGFTFQIFDKPAIAVVPMVMILTAYASRSRLPLGLPGGLAAVLVGMALAWGLRVAGFSFFEPAPPAGEMGWHLPTPALGELFSLTSAESGWRFFSVILPMGLFNVIGSLQNLESAEAAGDSYKTRPSLLANGLATIAAAFFGSPFPTTIYIGHPGWKAMGARSGYSVANGVIIALLCTTGLIPLVLKILPIEVTLGILLWVGIIIASQAFSSVPREHALAVSLGLIPALAAWGLELVRLTAARAGSSLLEMAGRFGNDLYFDGMVSLSQGFLLSSMLLAAFLVFVIEKEFRKAATTLFVLALLSSLGLIHAYRLTAAGIENHFGLLAAPEFAAAYALAAIFLMGLDFYRKT